MAFYRLEYAVAGILGQIFLVFLLCGQKDKETVAQKEVNKGNLIASFDSSSFLVFQVHRLKISISVININSLLPPVSFYLHYVTVDNTIKHIKLAS